MIVETLQDSWFDGVSIFYILGQVTLGVFIGYVIGAALKRFGAPVALSILGFYIAAEVLSYYDIITVNWAVLQGSPVSNFFSQLGSNLGNLISNNIAFTIAFIPGVVMGFRQTKSRGR